MAHFAVVSKYADDPGVVLPVRATSASAGYDLAAAEDIVIPPMEHLLDKLSIWAYESKRVTDYWSYLKPFTLSELATAAKEQKAKPTLVPTGVKCYLDKNQWLMLTNRSSVATKDWLILANGIGTIDADYVDNPENEGQIFVPLINLSPFAIQIKKGDRLVNAVIMNYTTVDDDQSQGERFGGFGSTNE